MDMYPRLRSFELFRGLTPDDIAAIAEFVKIRQFNANAVMCIQGDAADTLYLIEHGSVEVLSRVSDETQVQLAIRQEGDSIGETSLIENEKRGATVRTLEPVRALVLSRADMQQIIEQHPRVYIKMLMNLLREVRLRLQDADPLHGSSLFNRN